MANGRALPSALLFDWLLVRAWNMAMTSYANAERFGPGNFGSFSSESGVSTGGGGNSGSFLSKYAGAEAATLVSRHDQALRGQMKDVADYWAQQFNEILSSAVPVGPGFQLAVQWLRGVVNGGDGMGYVGQDRRLAQAIGYGAAVDVNPYALPLPAGATAALSGVTQRVTAFHVERLDVGMTADRAAELHKLRIDAAEALLRAHNAALDAVMEHVFTQMNLMFDVFGRNNDYLTRLQRDEQSIRALAELRTAELESWNERIMTTDDSRVAATQKIKAAVERADTLDGMRADANIKLLRRYSSRAAAALNSAGVSVSSTASESNNLNAGG
ncbi:MAG TPA: hypothetical protein PLK10_09160 [Ottowia sp.]|nr:hypothetical protein [Ottowia sp.]